jgi:hypothetical protein
MNNCSDTEHRRAYNKLHQYLIIHGFKLLLQKLDNEASTALNKPSNKKEFIINSSRPTSINKMLRNAIQNFKNHFVVCLCTTNKNSPLLQATMTLNLFLRTSQLNPKLPAEEHLNGTFDFNRTPLALLGTRIVLHEKSAQHGMRATHGRDGWCIGHAPEHY